MLPDWVKNHMLWSSILKAISITFLCYLTIAQDLRIPLIIFVIHGLASYLQVGSSKEEVKNDDNLSNKAKLYEEYYSIVACVATIVIRGYTLYKQ